jgi:hypothetical protein
MATPINLAKNIDPVAEERTADVTWATITPTDPA